MKQTPAQWASTRSLGEVLAEVLNKLDDEGLREHLTNAEVAEWMTQEVTARGIQVIS